MLINRSPDFQDCPEAFCFPAEDSRGPERLGLGAAASFPARRAGLDAGQPEKHEPEVKAHALGAREAPREGAELRDATPAEPCRSGRRRQRRALQGFGARGGRPSRTAAGPRAGGRAAAARGRTGASPARRASARRASVATCRGADSPVRLGGAEGRNEARSPPREIGVQDVVRAAGRGRVGLYTRSVTPGSEARRHGRPRSGRTPGAAARGRHADALRRAARAS